MAYILMLALLLPFQAPSDPNRIGELTNANRLVKVEIVKELSQGKHYKFDLAKELVFRVILFERDYTPYANDRDEWRSLQGGVGELNVTLRDRVPDSKVVLSPLRIVAEAPCQYLVAFQRRPEFFSGQDDLVVFVEDRLKILESYSFAFHYQVRQLFSDLGSKGRETKGEGIGPASAGASIESGPVADQKPQVMTPIEPPSVPAQTTKTPRYAVGEPISVGYWGYMVVKYEWSSRARLRIYLVCVNGDDSPSVLPAPVLVDEAGRRYEQSVEAGLRDSSWIGVMERLNPRVPKAGSVYFEVPERKEYWLELSGGYLSLQTAQVRVGGK